MQDLDTLVSGSSVFKIGELRVLLVACPKFAIKIKISAAFIHKILLLVSCCTARIVTWKIAG